MLRRFDVALIDKGSESRAIFITGTRGSGKTALVEQLSQKAERAGWRSIDLGPDHTATALTRALVRADSTTKTIAPQMSVSVMGIGGGVGGISTSKTITYSADDLQVLLVEACTHEKHGLFVSIDEAQKVPLDDLSLICGAFQMASRKGGDVILVMAGLPYAYDSVIHHEGCTFMRRAVHERLVLLTRDVARQAFVEAFERIDGLDADSDCIDLLVAQSLGHPYMVQLLGYYLVTLLNDDGAGYGYVATRKDAERTTPLALTAYESRALRPLVDELTASERAYLVAMTAVMEGNHVASTADVARALHKKGSQLSRTRDSLLRNGIVIALERGKIRFNVAYLRDYLSKSHEAGDEAALAEAWDI